MNAQDNIRGLLTGGDFERVGCFEHFWPGTLKAWLDQGYPHHVEAVDGIETKVADEHLFAHFDLDMYMCGGWFDVDPIQGVAEIVKETDEWVITRNGAGAALKRFKNKDSTPEHIDFMMNSREIWERDYRPHMLELDTARFESGWWHRGTTLADDVALHADGRARDKWVCYGHVFIWETMRQNMGDICMYESLLLDPGWIHDHNRVYTDFYKTHFQALFEETGLPDGIWIYEDLGYKNGLFASPRVLKELIFPYFAELVDFMHSFDLPVVLHTCGSTLDALPMIVDAGFDALNPMEVKAGNDPLAIARDYGDKLAFVGGLDIRFLETNDRAIIERQVIDLVEGMKARNARFVFHTDHSVTPNVKYDSYRYALDVYREHAWY
jgi:uroporphyrinogen decarboxylase